MEAGDGKQALEIFDDSFDLVITDWSMPEMDGIEFVKTLRARPDGERIPVLMTSSNNMPTDIASATKAGVNGYIVKPFELEAFQKKIREVLSQSG